MRRLVVVAVGVGLLFGCGRVTEKAFPAKTAKVFCKKIADCDESALDEWGADVAECRENLGAWFEDYAADHADCDYDAAAVTRCLRDVKKMSCRKWNDGEEECAAFYDCPEPRDQVPDVTDS